MMIKGENCVMFTVTAILSSILDIISKSVNEYADRFLQTNNEKYLN